MLRYTAARSHAHFGAGRPSWARRIAPALLLASCAAIGPLWAQGAGGMENGADLIRFVQALEARTRAVHVVASSLTELVAPTGRRRLCDTHLEAWFGTRMHTPMAVHFDPQIAVWEQGAAPYCETDSWSAFNGTIGTQRIVASGPEGQPVRASVGWILGERPGDQAIALAQCGWTSTLMGLFAPTSQTSDVLQAYADRITLKTLANRDIEVRIALEGSTQHLWILDGAADHALKYAAHLSGGRPVIETTVTSFHHHDDRVFPREITRRLTRSKDGSQYEECRVTVEIVDYDAASILVEGRFVLDFEPGCQVEDRLSRKTIVIGHDDAELAEMLNREARIVMSVAPSDAGRWTARRGLTALLGTMLAVGAFWAAKAAISRKARAFCKTRNSS